MQQGRTGIQREAIVSLLIFMAELLSYNTGSIGHGKKKKNAKEAKKARKFQKRRKKQQQSKAEQLPVVPCFLLILIL